MALSADRDVTPPTMYWNGRKLHVDFGVSAGEYDHLVQVRRFAGLQLRGITTSRYLYAK
jgi:hypothetical protein